MAEPKAYARLHLNPADVVSYAAGHPLVAGALALGAVTVLWWIGRAGKRTIRRLVTGRQAEDVLTLIAAGIATVVAMTGMWRFFGDVLHVSGPVRALTFAFIEIAVFTSALRARRNVRESHTHTAGIDGVAVWALTGLSAVLAALDAGSIRGALLRLSAPMVAAWLWERSMAVERRRATGRSINWRLTPERVLVRLGVAEATDRAATDVDAHRRLTRVARAAKHLRGLQHAGAASWRRRRALRRLDAAMARAVEHAGLASDPGRQAELLAQLGALYGAAALAEVTPETPWQIPSRRRPLRMYREPSAAERLDAPPHHELPFDTPSELMDWLEDGVPRDDDAVPPTLDEAGQNQIIAARIFADEVRSGKVPGIRAIKKRLHVGQPAAQEVQAYLSALATL